MLIINNLLKKYKNRTILNIPNFTFRDGLIYGIVGDNGSGKSTLMKCMTNLVDYMGSVIIDSQDVKKCPIVLKDVGVLIETPMFYNDMTAIQNLNYFLTNEKQVEPLLDELGLLDVANKKVKTYSLGMKQKLGVALTCLKGSKVIILDEPFNGLDVNSVNVVINLLKEQKAKGKTIIVSSHMPNTIKKLCDEVYKIDDKHLRRLNSKDGCKYVFSFDSLEDLEAAKHALKDDKNIQMSSIGIELIIESADQDEVKRIINILADYNMESYEKVSQELEAIY